jgi:hypothetical protein
MGGQIPSGLSPNNPKQKVNHDHPKLVNWGWDLSGQVMFWLSHEIQADKKYRFLASEFKYQGSH